MPRNIRNFWLELDVDGKKTRIATGPVRKDGGFTLAIKMRDKGGIIKAMEVRGYAHEDNSECAGQLLLTAESDYDQRTTTVVTTRS